MTTDEFAKYWLANHVPVAKKLPGLRKYVVNVVKRPPNKEPEYNGTVELWFDDKESMKSAFSSGEGKMVQRDTEFHEQNDNPVHRRTLYLVDTILFGCHLP